MCALSGALLAPPASAATQDFFEDGIPGAMGNLVVGARGDQTFDPVAAWISPTGALQRFQTYAATGSLIEVEPLPDGDYIALLEGQNQFRVVRFNADLTPDEACGPNGVGPATTGFANDLVVVGAFIFVGGDLDSDPGSGVDIDKALFRFDLDCSPATDADGSEFEGDGVLTQDPAGEPATIYDIEAGPGVLITVGEEGDDAEIDVFELDGDLFTGFNGTGQLTPPSDAADSKFLYVELRQDGDQELDAGDTLITGGQEGFGSTIGAVAGDGSVPPGLCPGHVNGFYFFEISATTADRIFSLDITPGGVIYASADVLQSNFQPDAYVNAYNPNLCDRSTGGATQQWVELIPTLPAGTYNYVGALEAAGENAFAIGGFDNVGNQSFDGYKFLMNPDLTGVAGYGTAGFAPIDLTTQPTPGPGGGGPGPGPGPGDGLPGDFDLNGAVDAADFVLFSRRLGPSTNGRDVGVEVYGTDALGPADQLDIYRWRVNYGRTAGGASASQRRRRVALVNARRLVTVRRGDRKRVRLPLTKAGKRFIRGYNKKRVKVTLRFTVRHRPAVGAAKQRTFQRRVTLRVKRKRR